MSWRRPKPRCWPNTLGARAAGQRFHNHSPLDFEKLKGDPDNIDKQLVSYIKGFSANVRTIFDIFEFEAEIEKAAASDTVRKLLDRACGTGGMLPRHRTYLREHHTAAGRTYRTAWAYRRLRTGGAWRQER